MLALSKLTGPRKSAGKMGLIHSQVETLGTNAAWIPVECKASLVGWPDHLAQYELLRNGARHIPILVLGIGDHSITVTDRCRVETNPLGGPFPRHDPLRPAFLFQHKLSARCVAEFSIVWSASCFLKPTAQSRRMRTGDSANSYGGSTHGPVIRFNPCRSPRSFASGARVPARSARGDTGTPTKAVS
jgi:hypothetical protein